MLYDAHIDYVLLQRWHEEDTIDVSCSLWQPVNCAHAAARRRSPLQVHTTIYQHTWILLASQTRLTGAVQCFAKALLYRKLAFIAISKVCSVTSNNMQQQHK
jgi:hypothetical protein